MERQRSDGGFPAIRWVAVFCIVAGFFFGYAAGSEGYVLSTSGLSVSSTPEGAAVAIDGISAGTTPLNQVLLSPGAHTVVLKLAGYQDYTASVTLTNGKNSAVMYILTPVCPSGYSCMAQGSAIQKWGANGYDQYGSQSCGATGFATDHPVAAYCYRQRVAVAVTTTTPVPARVPARVPAQPVNQTPSSGTTTGGGDRVVLPVTLVPAAGTNGSVPYFSAGSPIPSAPSVSVNGKIHFPNISTSSPYYGANFSRTANLSGPYKEILCLEPETWFEVAQAEGSPKGGGEFQSKNVYYQIPYGDSATVFVNQSAGVRSWYFRYEDTKEPERMIWQVSTVPFSCDMKSWKNPPGLVAMGDVENNIRTGTQVVDMPGDGRRYFILNTALFANRHPAEPAHYYGSVIQNWVSVDMHRWDLSVGNDILRIPRTDLALGPVTVGVPSGVQYVTDADLKKPYANGTMVCRDCLYKPERLSQTAALLLAEDRTYYVRLIPVDASGTAVSPPSLEVALTVTRQDPGPAPGSPSPYCSETATDQYQQVRPPVVRVVSYIGANYWEQAAQHADSEHFMTHALIVKDFPIDTFNTGSSQYYKTGQRVYWVKDRPGWLDDLIGIVGSVFDGLKWLAGKISAAYQWIQAEAVKLAAVVVDQLMKPFASCSDQGWCTAALTVALETAMSSVGLPPSVPSFEDLQNMGTDYLVSMAADEIGAGPIVDKYERMNSMTSGEIAAKVRSTAEEVIREQKAQTSEMYPDFWIPDPMFSPHPGIMLVQVSNPNPGRTDAVYIQVVDNAHLYMNSTMMVIPPLDPGQKINVPVTLPEDLTYYVDASQCYATLRPIEPHIFCVPCGTDACDNPRTSDFCKPVSLCARYNADVAARTLKSDTFTVKMYALSMNGAYGSNGVYGDAMQRTGNSWILPLGATSSDNTFLVGNLACANKTHLYVTYPQDWQVHTSETLITKPSDAYNFQRQIAWGDTDIFEPITDPIN